jgi:hypothetical protein
MKHSVSLTNIAPAIKKAQANIRGAIKDANNPFFKSKYADLESCWEAVKEPLQAEGLSVVQTMGFIPGAGPTLITTLLHMSGEYITGEQPVCAKSDNPQDMGSAITYARRYGLSAIVGLIQVDDDAEGYVRPRQSQQAPLKAVQAGAEEPGSYVLQCQPYAGKRLDEVGQHDLDSTLTKWKGRKISAGPLVTDLAEIEKYLDFVERPAHTQGRSK